MQNNFDPTAEITALVLNSILNSSLFSITTFNSLVKLNGLDTSSLTERELMLLEALHCKSYSLMTPELKNWLKNLLINFFKIENITFLP